MITEDRAIQLLERANPRPDSAEAAKSLEGTGYLAVIKTRSSETQTIDIEQESPPEKRPPKWGWLALAAAIVAIVATVGIVLANANEEAPIATTPEVEEPEPVPTTEPTPTTEPEAAPESTVPSTQPEPEELVGVSGLPIFTGQAEPGDYEIAAGGQTVIFTSDGTWKECSRTCDNRGRAYTMRSELVPGSTPFFDTTGRDVEDLRAMYLETPDLVVGEASSFDPSHPDAEWTGSVFYVTTTPNAPQSPACTLYPDEIYPCVGVEWFEVRYGNGASQYIHGPTAVFVLSRDGKDHFFVTSGWPEIPLPPDGAHEASNEQLAELVGTIRFVD